jgi:hypothetical protein
MGLASIAASKAQNAVVQPPVANAATAAVVAHVFVIAFAAVAVIL